ncbi:amidase [Luteibacter sp. UNCMF366Tsu5.1]|uniref:amidase n=1 Tax=Luteibacter sp. UNCMF366Tsu5.1 TaxID=1502758 RepID=UPI000908D4C0|nr:amidase [Luteibacter sp. UNCMF366Tsu5.1]SFW18210.1 amidase [Luteibacter sp. UNCMF366Tsu5.1]
MTPLPSRLAPCLATALTLALAAAPAHAQDIPARRTATVDDAYLSIAGLRQAYARGELTPLDMTLSFLDRINAIDRAGPTLRSVIETNPDAAIAAHAATQAYCNGATTSLTGIPILLKDNIETGDRMRTSAGSLLFPLPARQDATVTAKLREAGAIILGKANLTEWANFRSMMSIHGWSARGGTTLNPFALYATPLGSSSGSGAAVAAGLATAALGTETQGSIIGPAMAMGLVGMKPTIGLVSRTGIIPLSHMQDSAGPMTRSVADAAAVLKAIAGSDPTDPLTVEADRHVSDYTLALAADAVRGMRIGVVRRHAFDDNRWGSAMDRAVEILESKGAIVVDNVELPATDVAVDDQLSLVLTEFKHDIASYLARRTEQPLRTLEQVIAFNEAEADRELIHFGQELFEEALLAPGIDDPDYVERRLRARRVAGPEGIDATLATHKLDALIGPFSLNAVAALAGYPILTVPTHFEGNLPKGVMLYGTKWSEAKLLTIGHAIEQGANAFRRPTFIATPPPES